LPYLLIIPILSILSSRRYKFIRFIKSLISTDTFSINLGNLIYSWYINYMKKPAVIKAIISDLGRVFVDFDHDKSCGKLAKLAGCGIEEIYDFIYRSKTDIKLDRGELSPGAFYKRVKDHFNLKLSFKEFAHIFGNIFTLNKPVYRLYLKLKKKKYKIVFISNTNVIHIEHCARTMPMKKVFIGGIRSDKEGLMKPPPRLYLRAADLAGCKPEECVFIDDIYEYVDAARAVGLKGIQYRSAKQLKRDLKKLGVR